MSKYVIIIALLEFPKTLEIDLCRIVVWGGASGSSHFCMKGWVSRVSHVKSCIHNSPHVALKKKEYKHSFYFSTFCCVFLGMNCLSCHRSPHEYIIVKKFYFTFRYMFESIQCTAIIILCSKHEWKLNISTLVMFQKYLSLSLLVLVIVCSIHFSIFLSSTQYIGWLPCVLVVKHKGVVCCSALW